MLPHWVSLNLGLESVLGGESALAEEHAEIIGVMGRKIVPLIFSRS